MNIDDYAKGKDNNLNLIRFLAASLVIVTHSFGIAGHGRDPLIALLGLSFGSLAVNIFFVISGFLITKSWERKSDFLGFWLSRAKRIFPALWLSVLICVALIGAILTTFSLKRYFSDELTFKFIVENSTLLIRGVQTNLPGVGDINVPLWTLPYEMKMYVILSLIGVTGLIKKRWLIPSITLAAFALISIHYTEYARFIFYFFAGSTLYTYRSKIVLSFQFFMIFFSLLIAACFSVYGKTELLAISVPYLIIYLAFVPSGKIRVFNKLGDYSYGIYVFGFPVQILVYNMVASGSGKNFMIAYPLTVLIAALSWHLLEHRVLQWQPKLAMSKIAQD